MSTTDEYPGIWKKIFDSGEPADKFFKRPISDLILPTQDISNNDLLKTFSAFYSEKMKNLSAGCFRLPRGGKYGFNKKYEEKAPKQPVDVVRKMKYQKCVQKIDNDPRLTLDVFSDVLNYRTTSEDEIGGSSSTLTGEDIHRSEVVPNPLDTIQNLGQLDQWIRERLEHEVTYGSLGPCDGPIFADPLLLGSFNLFHWDSGLQSQNIQIQGVSTPVAIHAPAGSITPIHHEECNFSAVNILVCTESEKGCGKLWLIVHGSIKNYERFFEVATPRIHEAEKTLWTEGNSQYVNQPIPKKCEAWIDDKKWFIPLSTLFELKIPFFFLKQEVGDVVVTTPLCIHATINTQWNTSYAVNRVENDWMDLTSRAVLFECKCPQRGFGLKRRKLHARCKTQDQKAVNVAKCWRPHGQNLSKLFPRNKIYKALQDQKEANLRRAITLEASEAKKRPALFIKASFDIRCSKEGGNRNKLIRIRQHLMNIFPNATFINVTLKLNRLIFVHFETVEETLRAERKYKDGIFLYPGKSSKNVVKAINCDLQGL